MIVQFIYQADIREWDSLLLLVIRIGIFLSKKLPKKNNDESIKFHYPHTHTHKHLDYGDEKQKILLKKILSKSLTIFNLH